MGFLDFLRDILGTGGDFYAPPGHQVVSGDHERSEKMQRGRELIEEFLHCANSEFGVAVEEHTLSNGAAWWFNAQDNPMRIVLMEFTDNELYAGSILVDAYVAALPARNLLPLYRHLLEMNEITIEGAFAINPDDWITFCVKRDVDSFDSKEELENLVGTVAIQGQVHAKDLSNEFGCIPLDPWVLPTS